MNVLLELVRVVGAGEHGEWTILGLWGVRRREMLKTLERLEWDVERVVTLFGALGLDIGEYPQVTRLEKVAAEERELLLLLDRLLTKAVTAPAVLRWPEITVGVCAVFLALEWTIRPDERGILADLRDRFVMLADLQEVDLRGLGI